MLGEFLSSGNLDDKISEIDQEILSLERSKFKKTFLIFFERDYEPSETFIKLIDNKIFVLEERKMAIRRIHVWLNERMEVTQTGDFTPVCTI